MLVNNVYFVRKLPMVFLKNFAEGFRKAVSKFKLKLCWEIRVTAQKMKFSVKDFWVSDLVTFNEENLNGKLRFLCRKCPEKYKF